jgi:hypothetical protein
MYLFLSMILNRNRQSQILQLPFMPYISWGLKEMQSWLRELGHSGVRDCSSTVDAHLIHCPRKNSSYCALNPFVKVDSLQSSRRGSRPLDH